MGWPSSVSMGTWSLEAMAADLLLAQADAVEVAIIGLVQRVAVGAAVLELRSKLTSFCRDTERSKPNTAGRTACRTGLRAQQPTC